MKEFLSHKKKGGGKESTVIIVAQYLAAHCAKLSSSSLDLPFGG